MQHDEFRIGEEFWSGGNRWRCTDIGVRTIAAICLDRIDVCSNFSRSPQQLGMISADNERWFNGPPYAVQEHIFDEDSIADCTAVDDEPIVIVLPTSKERIQLSPKTTSRIWRAVRRGDAKDAEEYVMRLLDQALSRPGPVLPK